MASRYAADAVVFVSHDVRRHSAASNVTRMERVIYNGIEPFAVAEDEGRQAREDLDGITPGTFRVGVVGRLVPVKGHAHLLQAFAIVRRSLSARLFVFGEGPLESELRRCSETAGMDVEVRFMGFRRNVRAYLNSLDVLVIPSLHEGLPYTLLEAMYSKVPVVASNVGGLAEVIEHNVTGILVPPADPAALAAAIERLCREPRLRDTLTERAFARACERFLVDTMAAEYIDVYHAMRGAGPMGRHSAA
jgi:glycosyltransferase involved in cell wall biosynthesis